MAFLAGRVDDRHVAEDLAQDVLASALAHVDTLDPDRPLWPWLQSIARNRLIDHYRRTQTAQELDDHPRVREALSPYTAENPRHEFEDPGTRMGEHQLLGLAMRRLTHRQRSALLLHDVDGWSSEQIGALHGRNRNAVHQIIHRARNRARDEYQRLSGDKGALGLLPWPLVWASGLLRRTAARTRRSIQDWQLALPAFGESMASVAVVASVGLGAGAMWAGDPAEALANPNLTNLSDAALAASAEAAAPQLVPPEPTASTEEADLGEQQRLAAAISDAEPEAFEAQRAAEEAQAEAEVAGAEEADLDNSVDPDDRHLDEATETVRSSEAAIEPSVGTTESSDIDGGTRIQRSTSTTVEAGDLSITHESDGGVDSACDEGADELICETSEAASSNSSDPKGATDPSEPNIDDSTSSVDSHISDTDEYVSDTNDYASDRQEEAEDSETIADNVEEFVTEGYCEPDDAVGEACETVT